MLRRSRRIEYAILSAILILLMLNLIYFKKIEFQLDTSNYLTNFSTGTSERDAQNNEYSLFMWPILKEVGKHVSVKTEVLDFLKPEDLKQPTEEAKFIEEKNSKKWSSNDDDYDDESPSPTDSPDLEAAEKLIEALDIFNDYDFNDSDDDTESSIHSDSVTAPTKPEPPESVAPQLPVPDTINSNLTVCEQMTETKGRITPDLNVVTLDDVKKETGKLVYEGGFYTPDKCRAKHRVAIIVPYRNREKELAIFLKNIHPFLIKQQIEYGIFVVEQTVGTKFNRGMLLNVGFLEAKKIKNFDCYIFHDVDLLPMDDRNSYTCSINSPRHLAKAVDKLDHEFPALNTFSGVTALTSEQFVKINGYSNLFWGWGGEDLDFFSRLKAAGYHVDPLEAEIGRYVTFNQHDPEKPNEKRFDLVEQGESKFKTNGLNSVKYTVQCVDKCPVYTWILTTLHEELPGEGSNVEMLGVK